MAARSNRRPLRSWMQGAAVTLGLLAFMVGGFLLTDPLIDFLHAITGGNHGADVLVGFLALWIPVVVLFAILVFNARRRGSRVRGLWAMVVLVVPLDLIPYSRVGTDTALEHRLNTSLPFLIPGLLLGVAVLVLPVLVLMYLQAHRERRQRSV